MFNSAKSSEERGDIREMNIVCSFKPKTIRELVDGFEEDVVTGRVVAFGGNLDIRPAYQREYIYKRPQAQAVIQTVINGTPLSNMYWWVRKDGGFECCDGQQRGISICQFVKNDWTVKYRGNDCYFRNLPRDVRERILNYELQVFEVDGPESEKIAWFRTINVQGAVMTEQESRNSVYTGTWLTKAKEYFSRSQYGADNAYGHLTGGTANRQDILEIALYWITGDVAKIEDYMGAHQDDDNADELKNYFIEVCEWAEKIIGEDDSPARIKLGYKWGDLYREFKDKFEINREVIEEKLDELIKDDEVNEKPKGFYPFIISGDSHELFQRQFKKSMKEKKYREQNGICAVCGEHFALNGMEADHIIPWKDGGKTVYENLQMLCTDCNRRKSSGIC